jgi:hypothetical protein
MGRGVVENRDIYSPSGNASIISSVLSADDYRQLRRSSPGWRLSTAPAHFGYAPDPLHLTFQNPAYLWVTAPEKAYYTQVWPQGGRFTPEDFILLDEDPKWNRLYSTSDITIWGWNDLLRSASAP